MNYKLNSKQPKTIKEIQEIENLILAYEFAQSYQLNEINFLNAHKILSQAFVIKNNQGRYRNDKVGIFSNAGLVYLSIEPEYVFDKMNLLFKDITYLIKLNLSKPQVFYFASMIHLVFAHIYPFRDGNGRIARLLEKWFVTTKLGDEFWNIPSEEFCKNQQREYYNNINLGVNYYELNYKNCLPFLTMLSESLETIFKI